MSTGGDRVLRAVERIRAQRKSGKERLRLLRDLLGDEVVDSWESGYANDSLDDDEGHAEFVAQELGLEDAPGKK